MSREGAEAARRFGDHLKSCAVCHRADVLRETGAEVDERALCEIGQRIWHDLVRSPHTLFSANLGAAGTFCEAPCSRARCERDPFKCYRGIGHDGPHVCARCDEGIQHVEGSCERCGAEPGEPCDPARHEAGDAAPAGYRVEVREVPACVDCGRVGHVAADCPELPAPVVEHRGNLNDLVEHVPAPDSAKAEAIEALGLSAEYAKGAGLTLQGAINVVTRAWGRP